MKNKECASDIESSSAGTKRRLAFKQQELSNNKDRTDVVKAMEVIKQAMVDDGAEIQGSLAHAWHCNIAMMCHDAILAHDDQADYAHNVGNDAAIRFMKLCFDVTTKA